MKTFDFQPISITISGFANEKENAQFESNLLSYKGAFINKKKKKNILEIIPVY